MSSFYAEALARHRQASRTNVSHTNGEGLLFVTGFDKSGTTWLKRMLDMHPEIVCRAAGQFFNFTIDDIPYLSRPGGYDVIVRGVQSDPWFASSGKVWVTPEGLKRWTYALIADCMESFRTDEQVRYVGDKSCVQDCDAIRSLFPKAKVVSIVRDGRDVSVSFAHHFQRKGRDIITETGRERRLATEYRQQIATAWHLYNQHLLSFAENDTSYSSVRYEDLLERPHAGMKDLFAWLKVDHSSTLVQRIVDLNSFQRLSGGRERGEESTESFFRKGVMGDWREYFSDSDRAQFEDIAGETLEAYGYQDRSAQSAPRVAGAIT